MRFAQILSLLAFLLLFVPVISFAELEPAGLFIFAPACEANVVQTDAGQCPSFAQEGSRTLITTIDNPSDPVEVDLLFVGAKPVSNAALTLRVVFDTKAFSLQSSTLLFPVTSADPRSGKQVADGVLYSLNYNELPAFARIARLVLVPIAKNNAMLKSSTLSIGNNPVVKSGNESLSLFESPSLSITFATQQASSTAPVTSASASSGQLKDQLHSAAPGISVPTSAFSRLQVQNLAVLTSPTDMSILVSWIPLNTQHAGYSLYYGTVSGLYTFVRRLSLESSSTVLTGLESGRQYYFAIRAVNNEGVESAFSKEATVAVGNPETAFPRLDASLLQNPTQHSTSNATINQIPNTASSVPSISSPRPSSTPNSGVSDIVLALFFVSSLIGVVLASRRARYNRRHSPSSFYGF